MTVRADDIALGDLGKDCLQSKVADHSSDPTNLGRRVTVIEVHRALGKDAATVPARNGAQLVEDIRVMAPALALRNGPYQHRLRPSGEPGPVLMPRSKPMTVSANDVALGRFGEELLSILQGRPRRGERELLPARISMVEVHLVRGEKTATVGTGDIAQLAEEGRGRCLASRDPFDLALAVGRVVPNIVRTLVALSAHDPL